MVGIWAVVLIGMLILEASTQALVSIWFAAGALCALLSAAFGAIVPVQIAVFFFVSGILLAFLLPYARKRMKTGRTATNADRIIGAEGLVTEDIDGISGAGQVRVMGTIWSAKSLHGIKIPAGEKIEIVEIAGVKAVVKRKEQI